MTEQKKYTINTIKELPTITFLADGQQLDSVEAGEQAVLNILTEQGVSVENLEEIGDQVVLTAELTPDALNSLLTCLYIVSIFETDSN